MNRTAFILIPLALAFAYAGLMQALPSFGLSPWVAAAAWNSIFAALSLVLWKPQAEAEIGNHKLRKSLAWSAGPIVLMVSLALCLLRPGSGEDTRAGSGAGFPYTLAEVLILCAWIPLVEEILFRRFVYRWIAQRCPGYPALYLSGLVFALAHTAPPAAWLPPLGPFLLGVAVSWVYRESGQLLAPILLHAACNATPLIFTALAPGWLDSLSGLYQRL